MLTHHTGQAGLLLVSLGYKSMTLAHYWKVQKNLLPGGTSQRLFIHYHAPTGGPV